jgi:isocitrate dehydrogenase
MPQTHTQTVPITVAYGDGIGPEIMDATLKILEAAQAKIAVETIEIGEAVYKKGFSAGIEPKAWESLRRTRVFLKAPITTPQGGGFKSLNVTVRKTMGLYANVRRSVSYYPYVETKHPVMDVVIVRENEEDLYAGIEYQQTLDSTQSIKLITRKGCQRIVRYAFEYALRNKRKKVTCFTKDNIMKMTDGLFHKVFDEISADYPEIEKEHWIVDIGAAKLADSPEAFDVIVMPNLYGDVLSDVAAQIAGSVGLAGSSNIGQSFSMFEAIHGSAPRRAGQNLANPSGLLFGAIEMMVHIGQPKVAQDIQNAWLKTIEDGIHTYDIFKEGVSKKNVGTREFAQAVIARLGEKPKILKPVEFALDDNKPRTSKPAAPPEKKTLLGVDIFVDSDTTDIEGLAKKLQNCNTASLQLKMVSSRGLKVWPDGFPETSVSDQWRCRFMAPHQESPVLGKDIVKLIDRVCSAGIDFIQTQNLYNFDARAGYSKEQGE